MILEDQLEYEERIRLEALSQSVQSFMVGGISWNTSAERTEAILNRAEAFEAYIKTGRIDEN